ncbi:MAG TPA: M28 family peptidase [Bacteroidota bacterium]|nr:M28 family peptidase [Bacteroidota bacterium]
MKRLKFQFLLTLFVTVNIILAGEPPKTIPVISKMLSEISSSNLQNYDKTLVAFGTRHTLSDTTSDSRGIGAARRWLKTELEKSIPRSNGRLSVGYVSGIISKSVRIDRPVNVVDVIATLSPAHPDSSKRIFIVSAHYDSRASEAMDSTSDAPGADDDGSGAALVLELARAMSKYEFRSTIVFALYAGEEQGLYGSTILADSARAWHWNIGGVLNNDIVGSIHGGDGKIESTYVRCFSSSFSQADTGGIARQRIALGLENDGASRSLARYAKETSEAYIPDFSVHMVNRLDRFLRGGDQTPFHERGFASVRFTEAKEDFTHQHQNVRDEKGTKYGDLIDHVDFEYLRNICRVNGATLAELALAPNVPQGARVITKELTYDTELRWNRNVESDLAGYIVRYRPTDSMYWQSSVFTADTSMVLPISKDDYLFAVQSVDLNGNKSLVSIPKPLR